MLTLSKPLSAGQVRSYHEREFASERQNYWSRDQQGHSEWRGQLAEEWGLSGAVGDEQFALLTEGQHPFTEARLVRHQVSRTYEGKNGKEITSVEHRAGWDGTFSAPKDVSSALRPLSRSPLPPLRAVPSRNALPHSSCALTRTS